ncbi:MAG: ArsR family transcriptional regulator [Candidatus Hodarchaeota archaeon]
MSIDSEQVIIHGINHEIRREILQLLRFEPKTFSELLNYFDISTGKLNYHLTQIKGFTQKK